MHDLCPEPGVTNKIIRVHSHRFVRNLAPCSFVVKLVSWETYRQSGHCHCSCGHAVEPVPRLDLGRLSALCELSD